jgi:HSP90 family molecular chaperone
MRGLSDLPLNVSRSFLQNDSYVQNFPSNHPQGGGQAADAV